MDELKAIRDILEEIDKNIHNIRQIVGHGAVNKVFIVDTESQKLVVRVNDNRGFDEFIKEEWCIGQAALRGVPSPRVIKLGRGDYYSYMVETFLEGDDGSHAPIDSRILWKEIGKLARVIHTIPVSGLGLHSSELMPSEQNTSRETWGKYVKYNIDSLTREDTLLEIGALTWYQSSIISHMFQKLLHKQFSFGLVHGDLSLKNIMVSQDRKISILDWGSAEAQIVPHHELGEILKTNLDVDSEDFRSFLEGYGLVEEGFQEIREDLYTLMLLRSIDKLRWALDKHVEDVSRFVTTVKKMCEINSL
jgi:fructosamine-3-kinase